MQRVYVSVRKEVHHRSLQPVAFFILLFVIFIAISVFMRGSYNGLRETWIERLRQEREVADTNSRLKTELSVIMRGRYIALKANERLGLKKPNEEEVLVLK